MGPELMVPQPQDAYDMWANLKWFVGKGSQPKFDRFTYWEKFDYWAVFWGMLIIGGSGLMLWFPTFFIVPAGLGTEHSNAGAWRRGVARGRLHFHDPFFQWTLKAGEVSDGHGDSYRGRF